MIFKKINLFQSPTFSTETPGTLSPAGLIRLLKYGIRARALTVPEIEQSEIVGVFACFIDYGKKIIFLSFILCFMSQIQCSQEPQTLLLRGKELFFQAKYQDAFNVYQRISDKNFVVFYNMALCCLRLDQKTQALLFCKRAEKQAQSYRELTLIEELLKLDEAGEPVAKGWREQLAIFCKKVILTTPTVLLQIIIIVGLIFLMMYWYMRRYRHRKIASFLLVMLWLLFYYVLLCKIYFIQQQQGVIMEKTIPVFAGPDASFYKKSDLSESQLVVIVGQQDQYYKIKLGQLAGWIDSHHIELV